VHGRWSGRCDACGGWNTIAEETPAAAPPKGLGGGRGRRLDLLPLSGAPLVTERRKSGIGEFDRVCGGGLVAGSCTLIGGDPGIGKSTVLLQVVGRLAAGGSRCIYVSGEEAVDQIRMRAARLGLSDASVDLASATAVRDVVTTLETAEVDVVVIDSIQTMYVDTLDSAPGTVAQVRSSAQELIQVAKRRGVALLLVGHVTKEGTIAGPRVLEHMVDTVLYFEGERGHQFRILRAVKNRFGPTDEIGVFEMTGRGLLEVENPSALFLGEGSAHHGVSGSSVFAGMEGSRPLLVEIQALVGPPALSTPRRAVVGWDSGRLAMVLAVLETRCGLEFGSRDIYLNIAGGLRIGEPAADLAVAAAMVSSFMDRPVPEATVLFGEIGLAGEVRAVGQIDARLKEAAKLGFTTAITPARHGRKTEGAGAAAAGIAIRQIGLLQALVDIVRDEPTATGPAWSR